jgi:hypothetical protein
MNHAASHIGRSINFILPATSDSQEGLLGQIENMEKN